MFKVLRAHAFQLATIVLLLQAAIYYSVSRTEYIPPTPPWSEFPAQVGNWRLAGESVIDDAILDKLRPDDYIDRTYASAQVKDKVNLFVAYFKTQRKGFAPHSPKACLPGAGWEPVSSEVANISVQGHSLPVNLFLVEKQRAQMLVLYWYQQGKREYTGELSAQFHTIPQLLLHGRTDIALIRIIVPVSGSLEQARTTAENFAFDAYPLVLAHQL